MVEVKIILQYCLETEGQIDFKGNEWNKKSCIK